MRRTLLLCSAVALAFAIGVLCGSFLRSESRGRANDRRSSHFRTRATLVRHDDHQAQPHQRNSTPPTGTPTESTESRERARVQAALEWVFGPHASLYDLIRMAEQSPDPRVRAAALKFELSRLDDQSKLDYALDEIRDARSPEEGLVAAEFLGRGATGDEIRQVLETLSPFERRAVVCWSLSVALNETGQSWAITAWARDALNDLEQGQVGVGVESILRMAELYPVHAVHAVFLRAARDQDVGVRRSAVRGLSHARYAEALELLEALGRDADQTVREEASSALRQCRR